MWIEVFLEAIVGVFLLVWFAASLVLMLAASLFREEDLLGLGDTPLWGIILVHIGAFFSFAASIATMFG